jgi:uncharacterized membrane protein
MFADRRDRIRSLGIPLLVGTIVAVTWNFAYPFVPGKYWGTGADPGAQVRMILGDLKHAAWTFYSTVRDWHGMWWLDSTIRWGGHPSPYSMYGPDWLCRLMFALIIALILIEGGPVDLWLSFASFVLAVAYFVLLMIAFWIGFTPPGSPTIDGIQGRYFMLIYLLLAMALLTVRPRLRVPSYLKDGAVCVGLAVHTAILAWSLQWMDRLWAP